jgi:hypothetical protein
MSSNAPPMTTSPDRPSTNNPQDLLITPNHIPVVTQTEDNSLPFEHLIRAIAITDHEHVSPSILDNQYEDEMTHEQIPAASQTPNDTITTPIVVNLPLKDRCSDRSSHLSAERDCRKNDGICLFEANTAFKRRKLNHVQPSTTLLSFLRIEEYDGKVQDFSNTIKATWNSMPGQRVTLLISSKSHSILTSSFTRAQRLRELFKKTIHFNPLQPVQFGKNLFFALQLTVCSNVHYTDVKVSSYHIIISGEFSLPSFNSLILFDSPCHYHHSTH